MSKALHTVWRLPVIFTVLIWVGLLDALLTDNPIARGLAWLLLAVPILASFRFGLARRQ